MNPASPPDTPSEWSKFSPLPSRLRNSVALPESETVAAADPSSASITLDASILSDTRVVPDARVPLDANSVLIQIDTVNSTATEPPAAPMPASVVSGDFGERAAESFSDHFVCQNRKCQERRERRQQAPRHLFTAHWRPMKIGKRQVPVLDLTIACPDCGYEHHDTLVPPEWDGNIKVES